MRKTHKIFLDKLRDSGVVNMYGATPYLQRKFKLEKKEAMSILKEWMDSYEIHKN